MLSKLKKSNVKGFTIIEVMIVLAIAGLILLIVFLAVPALQRSSRNNSRKSSAARIAAAVSDFVSNNNGRPPTTTTDLSTILSSAGTLGGEYTGFGTNAGAMTSGKISVQNNVAIAAPPTIAITGTAPTDAVLIDTAAQCDPANSGQVLKGTSLRSIAMLYTIEPGSGTNYTIVCQDI
jgi:prepilin-type N-terminal cleavage/methylation domain-containing protein